MSGEICLILTTVDDGDAAQRLARSLVELRLAACVQMLPRMRSFYRWQGKTEEADEFQLQIKTAAGQAVHVTNWLMRHHPYELPEIVRFDGSASAAYAAWISEAVAIPGQPS